MNELYFAMMATRATGGSMTKADTDAIERVARALADHIAKVNGDNGWYDKISDEERDYIRQAAAVAIEATELADLRNRVAVLTEAVERIAYLCAALSRDSEKTLRANAREAETTARQALSSSDNRGGV
jgi:ubiquinone biosynthesis protein UbiJ